MDLDPEVRAGANAALIEVLSRYAVQMPMLHSVHDLVREVVDAVAVAVLDSWTPTATDRHGDWVRDPRGRRTYLIDAYLADPPLQDDWALLANADADDVRANLQTLIERLTPRPLWHPDKPGDVEGLRELLADSGFDRIGSIHNDDVRALLAYLDRARAELAALRTSPPNSIPPPEETAGD